MFNTLQTKNVTGRLGRILFIHFLTVLSLTLLAGSIIGQTPAATPASSEDQMVGGYKVTSTTEVGYRFLRLSGNENKYKSDLNYKQGFRSFDSNTLFESDSGKGKYFDSLLISTSGWGADPTGFARVNMEKTGIYKFNSSVRQVRYFNDLLNHANPLNTANPNLLTPSEHSSDTRRTFGDFDLSILPQNEKLRFNFGASFNSAKGPGVYTVRYYSDEFPIINNTLNRTDDYRAGVEGQLFGFDLGLTQGFRVFKDRSDYSINGPNPGNNQNGTSSANAYLATFYREFPTDGHAYYTAFNAHRTFAKKLDFTGRIIYSSTNTRMQMTERITGRDNSNNYVDLDYFEIGADSKRTQTRGDIGLTYTATSKFRISNTFSFDQFTVSGEEALRQQQDRRNAAGTPLAQVNVRSVASRITGYKRYMNTLEGDYQFNNSVSLHLGYRYTHRQVDLGGYSLTLTSPVTATNPSNISGEETNSTNTFFAGMKIKPVKNWVIFWDVDRGSADNVFSRLENYKFTNFRVRTRYTVDKFAFNFSAVSKDNTNPSKVDRSSNPLDPNLGLDFGAVIKNRFYSGTIDWTPIPELTFSSGYTYHHLTSHTAIYVYVVTPPATSSAKTLGYSEYYMRDHYAFFDVTAKPAKWMSLYASYRISRDFGQGDRLWVLPQNIITSYPMQFQSPEFRVAFRITRNVDWNVGYQYFDYKDSQTPLQNYRSHLPYTSLKIYFGGGAADR